MKRILTCTLECAVVLSLSAGLGGCSRYGDDISPDEENRFTLSFAGEIEADLPPEQATEVYAGLRFVAYQPSDGRFSHEVVLTRGASGGTAAVYKGMMRTGEWGLAAVTPGRTLNLPGAGTEMASAVLYEMPEDASTCTELFFNSVSLPLIAPDRNTSVDMALARNMSQVYVRIADKHGIVKPGSAATVKLHKVPTTISWAGTILPDKTSPKVRTAPIVLEIPESETWTTHDDGYPISSDDHFTVIPAHRGSDFWMDDGLTMNENPADILEHKMEIELIYTDKYGKEIEVEARAVPRVPVCNGRIVYNLIPQPQYADVQIETELLPWNVEDSQIEIEARPLKSGNCVVVSPGQVAEFPVEDVFQTWNWEYNEELGGDKMDQSKQLVAEVLSGDELISAEVVNLMGSGATGAHCSVRVAAAQTGATGEATVGLKLEGDAGYRWIWHIHVTADAQALADGHCPWTAAGSDDRSLWGSAAPDKEKCFVATATQTGVAASYTPAKLVVLNTEPGALPYRITFADAAKNPAPNIASLYLWDMKELSGRSEQVYAVPGHATDICMQVEDAAAFNRGYLKIEQCRADGTFAEPQWVQIGKGTATVGKISVPYTGQKNVALTISSISVIYPDNSRETVAGQWQAEPCDENGAPVQCDWVTVTNPASGSITLDVAAQQNSAVFRSGPAVSGYDLSTRGGQTSVNTANCYIVNASGTYSLPLVYGNAIVGGQPNASAYTSTASGTYVLNPFVNHTGAGIADPYIYNNGISVADAKLLWQDVDGMIDESSVELSADKRHLTFRVTDRIDYGNAVLAVFDDAGAIAWSWHIWATDYDPYGADGTRTVQNKTAPNTEFDFMLQNLGWCPGARYEARSQPLLLTETRTGAVIVVPVEQTQGSTLDNNTFYQWGRKDPFPGLQSGSVNKPTYGPADYIWPSNSGVAPGSVGADITTWIQNPHLFCSNSYGVGDDMYNLWSANFSNGGVLDTERTVKTIYDPSPAGFVMPPSAAYTGFTTANGNWTGAGYEFFCNLDGTGETIYYYATGRRAPGGTGAGAAVGSWGYYWTTNRSTTNGYILRFSNGTVNVHYSSLCHLGYGWPCRSVKE